MVKVSVIIPVYNVEKYLAKCLDSLINQTLKDIEIICINDGSTDKSLEILNDYSLKDKRIRIFSQHNQGPSIARNLGIAKAEGEYIIFVDSDDWVEVSMCQKFYNMALQTDADITLSTFFVTYNKETNTDDRISVIKNNVSQCVFNFNEEIPNIIPNVPYETVCKLYKTDFLKKNNLKFSTKIKFAEDCCFFIDCCLKNPTITILNEPLYYYRVNTQNSLIKKPDTVSNLFSVYLYVKNQIKHSHLKNKNELYLYFFTRLINTILWYFNSCYTISSRQSNLKYLKKLKKDYKKLKNKDDNTYKKLKQCILDNQLLFFNKLFAPVIEIENRLTRFVVYLFSRQVINISNIPFKSIYYNIFYNLILLKLRILSHFRKIRIGFWVTESDKWGQQPFFEKLKQNKNFEPFILLSYFKKPQGVELPKEHYIKTKEFFKSLGNKIYDTFDADNYTFKDLQEFKPDIIFYQQPWLIPDEQKLEKNYKHSLLCYIPYCFYSTTSYLNYLSKFHGIMWKYFVETEYHKKDYKKIFGATNCEPVGSMKFDNFKYVDKNSANKYWKTTNKKRIVYAPHHSFNDGMHEVATFQNNGQFILELAKKHPETEWIFRPHPAFIDRLLKNSIMSIEEIKQYYKEWEEIGSISVGGNYYDILSSSDCLITDCISFLSEYAPTSKPVLHLRKDFQRDLFNEVVSKIDEAYYQIYTNEELERVFEEVVLNNQDKLATLREKNKTILGIETLASENIINYLRKELWLRG